MTLLRIILLPALALAACETGEAAEETGPTLLTADVTRGDLLLRAEATGTVEPVRRVEVKSLASGEILRLHADIGAELTPFKPGCGSRSVDPGMPEKLALRYGGVVVFFDEADALGNRGAAVSGGGTRVVLPESSARDGRVGAKQPARFCDLGVCSCDQSSDQGCCQRLEHG